MKTWIVILTWNFNSNISATMMTFSPLDFLGLSHRVLRKIKNAVYRLQYLHWCRRYLSLKIETNIQMR